MTSIILPLLSLLLLAALLYLTDRIARYEARLKALREADKRNLHQQRWDYQRGKIDGIREAAAWMSERGYRDGAAVLPAALLDKQPAASNSKSNRTINYAALRRSHR